MFREKGILDIMKNKKLYPEDTFQSELALSGIQLQSVSQIKIEN